MKNFLISLIILLSFNMAYAQSQQHKTKIEYYLGISPSALLNRFPAIQVSNDLIFDDNIILQTEMAKMLTTEVQDGYRIKLGLQKIIPYRNINYLIGANYIRRSTVREKPNICFGSCSKTTFENRKLQGFELVQGTAFDISSRLRFEFGVGVGLGKLYFDNIVVTEDYAGYDFNPFAFFSGNWDKSLTFDDTTSASMENEKYTESTIILSFNINFAYHIGTINKK